MVLWISASQWTPSALAQLSAIGRESSSVRVPAAKVASAVERDVFDAGADIDRLITAWVLDEIPHDYTDDRKWGLQEEMHTRLRLRKDPGGKLETYREREKVNHGDWSRYTVRLRDPDKAFLIELKNIHGRDDGRMGLEIHVSADLDLDGRVAKWSRGVQLYSVGANGSARIRLVVAATMATKLDLAKLPPDVIIDPWVEAATIHIDEFRLDHVGKFGGEVAQQVTKAARKALDEKIEEKEKDLAEKLNRKIESERESLRIMLSKAQLLEWTPSIKPHLSKKVQDALETSSR